MRFAHSSSACDICALCPAGFLTKGPYTCVDAAAGITESPLACQRHTMHAMVVALNGPRHVVHRTCDRCCRGVSPCACSPGLITQRISPAGQECNETGYSLLAMGADEVGSPAATHLRAVIIAAMEVRGSCISGACSHGVLRPRLHGGFVRVQLEVKWACPAVVSPRCWLIRGIMPRARIGVLACLEGAHAALA